MLTAFVTNMSPELMIHTEPDLKYAIEHIEKEHKEKRLINHHPNSVVTARMMAVSTVPFEIKRTDIVPFTECSKTMKNIFGAIGVVGDKKAAELEAAERRAAERRAAESYDLEPLDYEHIAKLNEREANQ